MTEEFPANHFPYHTMSLAGQGHVTANPDVAVIRLGVETTGYNLSELQRENAQISQNIINTLRQMDITEIKTHQYTIDKLTEYENGKQIDKGYSVRHILEVRTNNMEQIGNMIDTAVSLGTNVVEGISFELSEPDLYYQHALNLAVDNAIQKARSVAASLNIRLNPIPIRIIESSVTPFPAQQFQRELAATPIVPGKLTIDAFVTADFSY